MACYCREVRNSQKELLCDGMYSDEKKEERVVTEEVKVVVVVYLTQIGF